MKCKIMNKIGIVHGFSLRTEVLCADLRPVVQGRSPHCRFFTQFLFLESSCSIIIQQLLNITQDLL